MLLHVIHPVITMINNHARCVEMDGTFLSYNCYWSITSTANGFIFNWFKPLYILPPPICCPLITWHVLMYRPQALTCNNQWSLQHKYDCINRKITRGTEYRAETVSSDWPGSWCESQTSHNLLYRSYKRHTTVFMQLLQLGKKSMQKAALFLWSHKIN